PADGRPAPVPRARQPWPGGARGERRRERDGADRRGALRRERATIPHAPRPRDRRLSRRPTTTPLTSVAHVTTCAPCFGMLRFGPWASLFWCSRRAGWAAAPPWTTRGTRRVAAPTTSRSATWSRAQTAS